MSCATPWKQRDTTKSLADRLVLFHCPINHFNQQHNHNSTTTTVSDAPQHLWWPALLFESHKQAQSRLVAVAPLPAVSRRIHRQLLLETKQASSTASAVSPRRLVQLLGGNYWHVLDDDNDNHNVILPLFDDTDSRAVMQLEQQLPLAPTHPLYLTLQQAQLEMAELLLAADQNDNDDYDGENHGPVAAASPVPAHCPPRVVPQPPPPEEAIPEEEDDHGMHQPDNNNNNESTDDEEDPDIEPDDTWEQAWDKLELVGWTRFQDYDTSEERYSPAVAHHDDDDDAKPPALYNLDQLQEHVHRTYHWNKPTTAPPRVSLSTTIATTPNIRPTLPDPGGVLSSSASDHSTNVTDPYEYSTKWPQLARQGWTCCKAWNKLDHFYFCLPGFSRHNGTLGDTCFRDWDSVVAYLKQQDGLTPSPVEQPRGRRRSRSSDHVARKLNVDSVVEDEARPTVNKPTTTNRRHNNKRKQPAVVTVQKSKRAATGHTSKKCSSSNSTIIQDDPDWWRQEAPPTEAEIRPLLRQLGMVGPASYYFLPMVCQFDGKNVTFVSARGLGCFFLEFGIPHVDQLLHATDARQLERWAKWINTPTVVGRGQKGPNKNWLATTSLPPIPTQVELERILKSLQFEVHSGRYYLPGLSHSIPHRRGVHYFRQDTWNTEFRWYIRRAHQLSAAASDDHDDDQWFEQLPTQVRIDYVRLRVWAATCDQALPVFAGLPRPSRTHDTADTMRVLQRLAAAPVLTLDEFSSMDKRVTTQRSADEESVAEEAESQSMQESDSSDAESGDESIESEEKVAHSPPPFVGPQRKAKKENRAWYLQGRPPDFQTVIWPILQTMGFHLDKRTGVFSHASIPNRKFANQHELRVYMASHAIPNVDKNKLALDASSCQMLHRWAVFVHLDKYDKTWGMLEHVPTTLSEHKILSILFRLGWSTADGKYFRPAADRMDRTQRVAYSMDDVLVFIRGSEQWSVDENDPVGPGHYKHCKVFQLEMISLLLVAAKADYQIPALLTPEKKETRRSGGRLGNNSSTRNKKATGSNRRAAEEIDKHDTMCVLQRLSAASVPEPPLDLDKSSTDKRATSSSDQTMKSTSSQRSVDEESEAEEAESQSVQESDEDSVDESSASEEKVANSPPLVVGPKRKAKKDNRKWYLQGRPPDFQTVIWPILQTMGFHLDKRTGVFSHAIIPNRQFANQHELRVYMASHAIPHVDKKELDLDESSREMLHRWAVFVHLDKDDKTWGMLERALTHMETLKENKILSILFRLGWSTADGKYFRPAADRIGRTQRVAYELPEVLVFIRGSEQWSVDENDPVGPGHYGFCKVSQLEMISLLLRAATFDYSIPSLLTPKKVTRRRGSRFGNISSTRNKQTTAGNRRAAEEIDEPEDEPENTVRMALPEIRRGRFGKKSSTRNKEATACNMRAAEELGEPEDEPKGTARTNFQDVIAEQVCEPQDELENTAGTVFSNSRSDAVRGPHNRPKDTCGDDSNVADLRWNTSARNDTDMDNEQVAVGTEISTPGKDTERMEYETSEEASKQPPATNWNANSATRTRAHHDPLEEPTEFQLVCAAALSPVEKDGPFHTGRRAQHDATSVDEREMDQPLLTQQPDDAATEDGLEFDAGSTGDAKEIDLQDGPENDEGNYKVSKSRKDDSVTDNQDNMEVNEPVLEEYDASMYEEDDHSVRAQAIDRELERFPIPFDEDDDESSDEEVGQPLLTQQPEEDDQDDCSMFDAQEESQAEEDGARYPFFTQ